MARVCGRSGRKRTFEIYRHLSTPGTILDIIDTRAFRSGARPFPTLRRCPLSIDPANAAQGMPQRTACPSVPRPLVPRAK